MNISLKLSLVKVKSSYNSFLVTTEGQEKITKENKQVYCFFSSIGLQKSFVTAGHHKYLKKKFLSKEMFQAFS